MTEIPFLAALSALTIIWIVVRGMVCLKNKRLDVKRELVLLLMYINLAVIMRFTFFPMALQNGSIAPLVFYKDEAFPFWINLIPFVNLFDYEELRYLLVNVIGNTLMFVPSGVIFPCLFKRLDTFLKVVFAGAGVSLCIEILQLPFSVRASDIDDLILNTSGVIIGYGVYALAKKLKTKKTAKCSSADNAVNII